MPRSHDRGFFWQKGRPLHMTLSPILNASPLVQLHLAAALGALVLTPVMAAMRKGTARHKTFGWVWVLAMAVTSVTALGIPSAFNGWRFSPIHALSLVTLFSLTMAIRARRAGNIARHRGYMIGAAAGLVIAGAFTLLPHRIMGQFVFG
jgi:uncharacterized membrane protein